MNDQDVRDFLERMSAEEPVPFMDAGPLTRRARRRAAMTVVVGAVCVVVAVGALIAGVGVIRSAPTETPGNTPEPSVVWRTGGELPTDVVGGTTTATFEAFGSSWSITDDVLITLHGPLPNGKVFRSLADGQSWKVDVPGGTFLLEQTVTEVDRVSVHVEANGTIEGRWMETFRDNQGHSGRIWVVPLPGSGTGSVRIGSEHPTQISWNGAASN
jgi:hypothetical protein